jgi:general secretion pathway protein M
MAKLTLPFQDVFGKVGEAWASLSDRERRMLSLLFTAFVVTAVVLAFLSANRAVKARETSLAEKRMAMTKVEILASGYAQAEAARNRIEARMKGQPVRLFSYLEDLGKKQGVTIGDMQDRGNTAAGEGVERSTVEVNFARIDLHKLTAFVNEIEKSTHLVKVEKLRLRTRNDDPNLLDATLTVSTYQLAEKS